MSNPERIDHIESSVNWIEKQLQLMVDSTNKKSQKTIDYLEKKLAWEKKELEEISH